MLFTQTLSPKRQQDSPIELWEPRARQSPRKDSQSPLKNSTCVNGVSCSLRELQCPVTAGNNHMAGPQDTPAVPYLIDTQTHHHADHHGVVVSW